MGGKFMYRVPIKFNGKKLHRTQKAILLMAISNHPVTQIDMVESTVKNTIRV